MAIRHKTRRTIYDDFDRTRRSRYARNDDVEKLASKAYFHATVAGSEDYMHATTSNHASRSSRPSTRQFRRRRSSSTDGDYIARPEQYQNDYIQPSPRDRDDGYDYPSPPATTHGFKSRQHDHKPDHHFAKRNRPPRSPSPTPSDTISLPSPTLQPKHRASDIDELDSYNSSASDIEHHDNVSHSRNRHGNPRPRSPALGSDVVSRSISRSNSWTSDWQALKSEVGSDVQVWSGSGSERSQSGERSQKGRRSQNGRRRRSRSESEDEAGYIARDEYIGGGDCVSISGSEGGEGSDVVDLDDLDVGVGRDGVVGSDVEDCGEGDEDCIGEEG